MPTLFHLGRTTSQGVRALLIGSGEIILLPGFSSNSVAVCFCPSGRSDLAQLACSLPGPSSREQSALDRSLRGALNFLAPIKHRPRFCPPSHVRGSGAWTERVLPIGAAIGAGNVCLNLQTLFAPFKEPKGGASNNRSKARFEQGWFFSRSMQDSSWLRSQIHKSPFYKGNTSFNRGILELHVLPNLQWLRTALPCA